MMTEIFLHSEIFEDIKKCQKKGWYIGLGEEIPRICRLLLQDKKMPGERPVHYIKNSFLNNKIFHAGINLPRQNVDKRKGSRIIYSKRKL